MIFIKKLIILFLIGIYHHINQNEMTEEQPNPEQETEEKQYICENCYQEGQYIHVLGITFNIRMIDFLEFSTHIINYGRGAKNGKLIINLNSDTKVETFPTDKETLLEVSDILLGIINEIHQIKIEQEIGMKKQTEFKRDVISIIMPLAIIFVSVGIYIYKI